VTIVDQRVETLTLDDEPNLVVIQVYITNAYRTHAIADSYRERGIYVVLGGLHVTSMPSEASIHADTVILGPGDSSFPPFLADFRRLRPKSIYQAANRSLVGAPSIRIELISLLKSCLSACEV